MWTPAPLWPRPLDFAVNGPSRPMTETENIRESKGKALAGVYTVGYTSGEILASIGNG